MKKCTNCGHLNKDSDNFCTECGNQLGKTVAEQATETVVSEAVVNDDEVVEATEIEVEAQPNPDNNRVNNFDNEKIKHHATSWWVYFINSLKGVKNEDNQSYNGLFSVIVYVLMFLIGSLVMGRLNNHSNATGLSLENPLSFLTPLSGQMGKWISDNAIKNTIWFAIITFAILGIGFGLKRWLLNDQSSFLSYLNSTGNIVNYGSVLSLLPIIAVLLFAPSISYSMIIMVMFIWLIIALIPVMAILAELPIMKRQNSPVQASPKLVGLLTMVLILIAYILIKTK